MKNQKERGSTQGGLLGIVFIMTMCLVAALFTIEYLRFTDYDTRRDKPYSIAISFLRMEHPEIKSTELLQEEVIQERKELVRCGCKEDDTHAVKIRAFVEEGRNKFFTVCIKKVTDQFGVEMTLHTVPNN